MARLTEEQRAFIVIELACRRQVADVIARFREEYSVEIDRKQVHEYNPDSVHGKKTMAKKWRKLFEETRKNFDADMTSIAIASKNYRLRTLQEMLEKMVERGNVGMAKDLLKQAAEETGGAYTNRREFTGKDGKDLPAATGAVVILPAKSPIEEETQSDK